MQEKPEQVLSTERAEIWVKMQALFDEVDHHLEGYIEHWDNTTTDNQVDFDDLKKKIRNIILEPKE